MIKTLYKLIFCSLGILISTHCIAQKKIDTTESVLVGGIKQVVKIEGTHRSKPLFLFITGGPGAEGIYKENKTYLENTTPDNAVKLTKPLPLAYKKRSSDPFLSLINF